jgi:ribosomal protein L21
LAPQSAVVVQSWASRYARGFGSPAFCCRSVEDFNERADMYAVIKTGGKQYKVAAGEKIKIEQIAADVGQEITIDQVLAVGSGADLKVGTPLVSGASVVATVVAQGRHDAVASTTRSGKVIARTSPKSKSAR